ncbi:PQ-loop repeat-containing protein [Aspergillus saccharolyticus JOP 1030-1]|uniref:PQ loop repeat protein n=1 Tax=Aspergillus saccharolyticus JOP 1030-1 TaxID=1450539 RepID=A0A318ZW22_9EURO|nr:PQ loop repeat protein [Aspergillus saccharolyticus JOP 1030-1]PYH44338.1 PQ loop repeat protein [Aspergillus saccharolyticus JOP 1030-1]
MPPPLIQYIQPALPQHCEPTSPFLAALSSYLHVCVPTPLALISSLLGTLSIISWLFAQLPQIYKNIQLQSTSGLSLFFLVEWCLGDACNLLGALLTRQAGWQVIVAGYYVFVDVTLVFQYFWYTTYRQGQAGYASFEHSHYDNGTGGILEGVPFSEDDSISHAPRPLAGIPVSAPKDMKDLKEPAVSTFNGQSPSYSNEKYSTSRRSIIRTSSSGPSLPIGSPRTLLLASMLCAVLANAAPTDAEAAATATTSGLSPNTLEVLGRIISWMSTVLYLGSRPPQLYKNYCRKSTSGLSPLLFMAAFCGNFFYSASLLTNPNAWYDFPAYGGGGWADADGNSRAEWVSRAIPFFLGAFGVLAFDGTMGVQFLMYGSRDDESIMEVADPKDGRSHWTRVRGWMRGWIPSVSSTSATAIIATTPRHPENQALLHQQDQERYGAV